MGTPTPHSAPASRARARLARRRRPRTSTAATTSNGCPGRVVASSDYTSAAHGESRAPQLVTPAIPVAWRRASALRWRRLRRSGSRRGLLCPIKLLASSSGLYQSLRLSMQRTHRLWLGAIAKTNSCSVSGHRGVARRPVAASTSTPVTPGGRAETRRLPAVEGVTHEVGPDGQTPPRRPSTPAGCRRPCRPTRQSAGTA